MAVLSWDEILQRAKEKNVEIICEEQRTIDRRFLVRCLNCLNESVVFLRYLNNDKKCKKCYHFLKSKEEAMLKAKECGVELLCYLGKKLDHHHTWRIKCIKCDNIKESIVRRFDNCRVCSSNKQRYSNEDFVIKARQIHGEKYNYDLVKYKTSLSKVIIFCNLCKNTFLQAPGSHLRGNGCLICSGYKKYTKEEFTKKAIEIHGNRFDYNLVDYVNKQTKVKIFCNKCKKIFFQAPHNHLGGSGCPKCCESKGERAVRKHLNKLGIEHETQMTFPGLVHINELKYDFYFVYNGKAYLIEFDGEHHFRPVAYSNDMEKAIRDFEDLKIRDEKKNDYARNNGISLLRIPYWDLKLVPEVINKFLLSSSKLVIGEQLVLDI